MVVRLRRWKRAQATLEEELLPLVVGPLKAALEKVTDTAHLEDLLVVRAHVHACLLAFPARCCAAHALTSMHVPLVPAYEFDPFVFVVRRMLGGRVVG